ncbi:MAG: hypothetical protein ACEPOW_10785 [Bacteroidales bacterium]
MKSIKMTDKLSLSKERISNLKLGNLNNNRSGRDCVIAVSVLGNGVSCVISALIPHCTH